MSPKKIPVTVIYASAGAQPPIYLAGSFSEWHPEEMDFTTDVNNEHHFKKEVMVEEGGVFQYKFRIGDGDWWALNEDAPTVTDDLGNRNNLLTVPTSEHISTERSPLDPTPTPTAMENKAEPSSSKVDSVHKVDDVAEFSAHKEEESTEPALRKAGAKAEESTPDPILVLIPSQGKSTEASHFQDQSTGPPATDTFGTPPIAVVEALSVLPDPATSGAIYENIGESSGSETILTPQTPTSIQEENHEPLGKETTEDFQEKTPTPPRAHTPIPEVIVEKVDDEPRYGDDFGSDATSGQKEAHKMRAQDAEPDLVVVKPEISPESETAAEVADSAAKLDKEDLSILKAPAPNKTTSSARTVDEIASEKASSAVDLDNENPPTFEASAPDEATPSVQTAGEIASEVADSAAVLDKEEPEPLSPDEEAGRTGERRISHTPIPEVATTAAEVAETAALLDSDNFKIDMPRFKFVDPDSGSASGTATPAHERAPLFAHECPEPYEEDQEGSHLPVSDQDQLSSNYEDEEAVVDHDDPFLEQFPSDRDSILHTVRSCESRLDVDETQFQGSPSSPIVGHNGLAVDRDLEEPAAALLDTRSNASAQPSPILDVIKEEPHSPDDLVPLPRPSKAVDSELVEKELPAGTTIAVQQTEEETATTAKILGEEYSMNESPLETRSFITPSFTKQPDVSEPEPLTKPPSSEVVTQIAQSAEDSNGVSPQEVSKPTDEKPGDTTSKRVSSDGETFIPNVGVGDDGPKIVIQPATSGIPEGVFKDIDMAKSTSTENDTIGQANLKQRNQASSKRASTPTSLSPPHKDKDAQNIFEAIWRTVFVSWIGGLITRLCGGRRRPLLAVAIVVLTLAPALYFRVA